MLLDYLDHPTAELNYGILLVVLFFLCQLLRNFSFNLQQSIGIHTGKVLDFTEMIMISLFLSHKTFGCSSVPWLLKTSSTSLTQ